MEINGKAIVYGILIALVLLLLLISFGVVNPNFGKSIGKTASGEYSNIPEKCRPPSGESISAWKEHLSHHTDTQECLKYFS
ncbi:MAG: hypothetical protein AABX73_00650 [Nanoarchaeota archaeon]